MTQTHLEHYDSYTDKQKFAPHFQAATCWTTGRRLAEPV